MLPLLVLTICLNTIGFGQSNTEAVVGYWKVNKIKSLLVGSIYLNAEDLEAEQLDEKQCLSSFFYITRDSIIAENSSCQFINCTIFSYESKMVTIVNDEDSDPFMDDKLVSKTELEYLLEHSVSDKKLTVLYTNCPTGYGDFRLRILSINKNNIVLYNYYNAIFLERCTQ